MLEFVMNIITSNKFYLPIIYVSVSIIIYSVICNLINSISKIDINFHNGKDKRKNTIIVLIKNIIKYIIAIIDIILILGIYGVNTTSLIASLGVATAIIGLAFQDTIKDFLAGIFIIFDNVYAVGDYVKIGDFTGEVVSLGLKNTKIRAYDGQVKILSNSSFNEVINYNFEHNKVVVNIPVSYDTKIEKLEKALSDISIEMVKDKNVYKVELLGINEFTDSSINYAVMLECASMTYNSAKRKFLGLVKNKFDEEGIVIPYTQIDVHIDK